jgi:hypothetical protein
MAVVKVDLETPGGKMFGIAAQYIAWLKANLPQLNSYIAAVGNAAAIESATAEFGATVGSGQNIIDLAYEWNDNVSAISAADAIRGYQGEVV